MGSPYYLNHGCRFLPRKIYRCSLPACLIEARRPTREISTGGIGGRSDPGEVVVLENGGIHRKIVSPDSYLFYKFSLMEFI